MLGARTARGAFAAALAVWVGLCVVAPQLATAGVETWRPALSYQEARTRIDADLRTRRTAEAGDVMAREMLTRYGVASADELPVDLCGLAMVENAHHASSVTLADGVTVRLDDRTSFEPDARICRGKPLDPETIAAPEASSWSKTFRPVPIRPTRAVSSKATSG